MAEQGRRFTESELRGAIASVVVLAARPEGLRPEDVESVLSDIPASTPLTMVQSGERVQVRIEATQMGSGFQGLAEMFDSTVIDKGEGIEAIRGLLGAVPRPITEMQATAMMVALTVAMLNGYEVGRSI